MLKRSVDEMRVEVGVKESFKKKWEMKNRRKANAQKVEEKRRRERPKLRWGIALNDLERVREEWRKRATDRRNLRLLIENVVRGRKRP